MRKASKKRGRKTCSPRTSTIFKCNALREVRFLQILAFDAVDCLAPTTLRCKGVHIPPGNTVVFATQYSYACDSRLNCDLCQSLGIVEKMPEVSFLRHLVLVLTFLLVASTEFHRQLAAPSVCPPQRVPSKAQISSISET